MCSEDMTNSDWREEVERARRLGTDDARSIRELEDMTGRPAASLRPALRTLVDEGLVKATAPPQSRNRKYLRLND